MKKIVNYPYTLGLCVFSAIPFSLFSAETDKKPNVVFIICDDLNDYSGVFGGHPQARTPNIDMLAKTGVQFVNAHTNVAVSQPSRNSLFTGVYPHESKDFGWVKRTKQPVLKNNKTIMSLFKENGYTVVGTGKLLHSNEMNLWDDWGMDDRNNYGPFPFKDGKIGAHKDVPAPYSEIGPIDGSYGAVDSTQVWVYGRKGKPMKYIDDNNRDLLQDELHAQWAVNKIMELEVSPAGTPFFMGVGFCRPHTPLYAPKKYFDMFPLDSIVLDKWMKDDEKDTYLKTNIFKDDKGHRYYKTLLESYGGDRELALKTFLQAYLACVAFVDEQIGTVVDAVKQSKFKNNTIIVFTSDHGWQMGEKNFLFKNSPWDESTRIPMVWYVPGADAGKQVQQPVSLVDIFPTLVDMCSLSGDNKLNENAGDLGGFSMASLMLNDTEKGWSGPNGALSIIGNIGADTSLEDQHLSYRTQKWRYILYADGKQELYNHENDQYEWHNLAYDKKSKSVIKKLKKEISDIVGTEL